MNRRRYPTLAQVKAAADIARELSLRALEVRPDGSFRVELPAESGEGSALARWQQKRSA